MSGREKHEGNAREDYCMPIEEESRRRGVGRKLVEVEGRTTPYEQKDFTSGEADRALRDLR